MTPGGVHFHRDDYPATLALVAQITRHRRQMGYEPTPEGAYIDWAALAKQVSTIDSAALLIAQGCSILEGHGGASPDLRQAIVRAVEEVA